MGIRGELFTTQQQVHNRSYFFNVKENRNGDIFLQIVESKIKDGEDDRRAIVVFADDMQDFLIGMDDSLKFIEKEKKERAKNKAEKKAAKEAKYSRSAEENAGKSGKKIFRRKGESRLVAERRAEKENEREYSKPYNYDKQKTGRVIHVSSIREDGSGESSSI